MSARRHLSGYQFPSEGGPHEGYRSAYKRAQEIGPNMPTVAGSGETSYLSENRAARRHFARSSMPGEHLRGVSMIMPGSRGIEDDNSADYNADSKLIRTDFPLSGAARQNRGMFTSRIKQAEIQHTLLHEVGHHQEGENPGYSQIKSEALAENYAEKHRFPRLRYFKSGYDKLVAGRSDPASKEYRKVKRSGQLPGEAV